jgi:uncharacterized phiE125 gp8 family phage protein
MIIKSATEKVEKIIAKKLINQTWEIYFDHFPLTKNNDWWEGSRDGAISELYGDCPHLNLPFGPISSVTSVNTYDDDNTAYLFASTSYYADTISSVGRISLKSGSVWPSTVLRPANGIKIEAVFGYGADATVIPNDICLAITTLAARMYEHRGDELPEIPKQVMTLLAPYEEIRI